MRALRVGIIGLGVIGKNHARILSDLEGARLVAVCDEAAPALAWAAKRLKVPTYSRPAEFFGSQHLDCVVVAVPTSRHFQVAAAALHRGLHVLIEKPIAGTIEQAEELITLARERARVLSVGHVERFNPAVLELKRRLKAGEGGRILEIHARRLGPFPPRIRDVGVVIDLATHDLDVMGFLLDDRVRRLYAEIQRRVNTEHEDMVSALLKFEKGTVGVLEVNWLTPTKIRDVSVLAERGLFVVDYLDQTLSFYENSIAVGDWDGSPVLAGVTEGNAVRFKIERAEPLRLELAAFLRAAATGSEAPVSGEDGVRALRLALQLIDSGTRAQVIDLGAREPTPVEGR